MIKSCTNCKHENIFSTSTTPFLVCKMCVGDHSMWKPREDLRSAEVEKIISMWEPRKDLKSASAEVKKVIFHEPATIVYWGDGSKTVVKCQEGDTYDKEKGLALCFMKKRLGNTSRQLNDTLHKYCDDHQDLNETGNGCWNCKYASDDMLSLCSKCIGCQLSIQPYSNWEPKDGKGEAL